MIFSIKKLGQMKKAMLTAAAAVLLLGTGQGGEAEAAMKVPENIFQWIQSSPRTNYFFNKQQVHYQVEQNGEINLDVLVIPILKSFDDTQIQDVLHKRRWKMLDLEPYEDLAGQAEYTRFNTQLRLVYIDKVVMLDSFMGTIEVTTPAQTIDLQKLSEKHWERQFYDGILQYVQDHQDEIIAQTKGTLKKADAERLEKERYLRAHPEKQKKKKNKDKKKHYQQIEADAKASREHQAS